MGKPGGPLPAGKQPECDLWSNYIFGAECSEPHLRHTCGPKEMEDVLLKCIHSKDAAGMPCPAEQCMGTAGVSEMKDKHLSKADGKCAKLLYVSEVQVCRELEKECSESVDNAITMPDATEKLMSLKRTFCPFSEAASNGTFVSRAPCNLFGECVREKLSYSGCLGST